MNLVRLLALKGEKTTCYPRKIQAVSFDGKLIQFDHPFDPTIADNFRDRPPEWRMSALDLSEGALEWYDAGADGIFLFNMMDAWFNITTLNNLSYPQLLREDLAAKQTFGMRQGRQVQWE